MVGGNIFLHVINEKILAELVETVSFTPPLEAVIVSPTLRP